MLVWPVRVSDGLLPRLDPPFGDWFSRQVHPRLAWNLVEAGVAVLGRRPGWQRIALIAFGLDSVIELFAGGVPNLSWRAQRGNLVASAPTRQATGQSC